MAQPVNLNRYRKAKARAGKTAQAKENAVKFGRTKAQKDLEKAQAEAATKALDGQKREP